MVAKRSMLLLAMTLMACGSEKTRNDPPADTLKQATTRDSIAPAATDSSRNIRDSISSDCPWYTGTIDTMKVEMQLCRKGDELYGIYRYPKIGQEIEVQGHVESGGEFILYEWGAGSKKQTGNFLGKFSADGAIAGTWASADGTRKLKFDLRESRSDSSASTATVDTSKFNGKWRWEGTEGASFTLLLNENGKVLTGHHCSITSNARRTDCSMEGDQVSAERRSIEGEIDGRTATVIFQSTYARAETYDPGRNSGRNRNKRKKKEVPVTGTAWIIRTGDSLVWRITGKTTGEHWLPYNVTLRRAPADSTK